jgi:hypothetical protein
MIVRSIREAEMTMSPGDAAGRLHAAVGDQLLVRSNHVGTPDRAAEILEVRHEDGTPPYTVRWSDTGHVTLVFPGPDAFILRRHAEGDVAAD